MEGEIVEKERKIAPNWAPYEVDVLHHEATGLADLLDRRYDNHVSKEKKDKAWQHISTKVTAIGYYHRSPKACKKKWQNLKSISTDRGRTWHCKHSPQTAASPIVSKDVPTTDAFKVEATQPYARLVGIESDTMEPCARLVGIDSDAMETQSETQEESSEETNTNGKIVLHEHIADFTRTGVKDKLLGPRPSQCSSNREQELRIQVLQKQLEHMEKEMQLFDAQTELFKAQTEKCKMDIAAQNTNGINIPQQAPIIVKTENENY